MRVIYNTCFADPWIKIAGKLKTEQGWIPVYWNGYDDDNSKNLIAKAFPEAIYQPYYDGWKGIFSDVITQKAKKSFIEIDFLNAFAKYELQAIKMMDRMDPKGYGFNFMERQRHFRNLVKYWTAVIDYLQPNIVIQAHVPHRVFDYVLYLLCKHKNIKYLCFRDAWPSFTGRAVPITDISTIGNIFNQDYEKYLKSNHTAEDLLTKLPNEISDRFRKIQLDYSQGQPDFIKKYNKNHAKSNGFFPLLTKAFHDIFSDRYWGSDGHLKNGIPTYYKQKNKSIENSRTSIVNYAIIKLKTNKTKKKLKNLYKSKVTNPDLSKKYVILNLHYQPEMTSCPSGDIFVDQRLCVEILRKNLPKDYHIYIKEHPSQFYSHQEGHTGRYNEFYEDLLKYNKTQLIPLETDTFTLIRNAAAVATVTGTTGWEAMAMGKPVIIFGLTWYEKYNGVLRITDDKTASEIFNFIDTFEFNKKDLMAYLHAFTNNSVKGYLYRGIKEQISIEEDQCVNNICNALLQHT
jgi:hypothetical protein